MTRGKVTIGDNIIGEYINIVLRNYIQKLRHFGLEATFKRNVRVCSVAQSCLTLFDPMDCSSLGSSIRRISQARILKWVAISSSRGSSGPNDQSQVSCGSYLGRWVFFVCFFFFVLLLSHLGRRLREIPAKLIHIRGKINGWK